MSVKIQNLNPGDLLYGIRGIYEAQQLVSPNRIVQSKNVFSQLFASNALPAVLKDFRVCRYAVTNINPLADGRRQVTITSYDDAVFTYTWESEIDLAIHEFYDTPEEAEAVIAMLKSVYNAGLSIGGGADDKKLN